MKILMQGKLDLMDTGGGDKVQIENTAKELKKLGVEVDIIPGYKINYPKYDIVHLFQLDWTPETYLYAKKVKKYNKPLVLSPIHHSLQELIKFDELYVFDFRRVSKLLFKDQFKRDTLKNIYKSFFDFRKVYPTIYSVLYGLKKMQTETLQMADMVLVQTQKEAKDLRKTYDVEFKWQKVVNGVGEQFLNMEKVNNADKKLPLNDYIVCVGRIEARKNQINIVKAVDLFRAKSGKDVQLVFVGRKSTFKHFEYVTRFNGLVNKYDWVHFLGEVPYEDIPSYLKYAKVCVSASWFETTGLTSLEALFCGTNAVASGERAKEYLGDYVTYCEPDNIDSIASAVEKEYFAERPAKLPKDMLNYTWAHAARETLEIYKRLL